MSEKPFYLTSTLPYVNAEPHIGFALEIVHADIIARYNRFLGRKVFFNTGTDEHGQKVFQKAKEEGRDTQEYVDEYADHFKKLKSTLNLSYDAFIRTTDPHHVAAAQELWKLCDKAGDIYKKKYKGLYCVGDEMFLRESDLVNGKCPNHPNLDPQTIEEENYFFNLKKYEQKLLEYLSQEGVIVPEWRKQEAVAFVKGGLEDFSISREKSRFSWGVPVPGDESQIMYVWFDALTNYISTLGWPETGGNFEKFWQNGEVVQMAGKDQVRFQSIMWQAMLMSADIKPTDKVVYHGFITSGGQKISKSLGNVIDPLALVEEYGTDAVRYFLARHAHPFEDSDFTLERFKELYNADLANGLGNVVARIMQLAQTHLISSVQVQHEPFVESFNKDMSVYKINSAIEHVIGLEMALDQFLTEKEPFKVIKSDPEGGRNLITQGVHMLATLNSYLRIFMPETSEKIEEAIKENKKPENLFPRKE